MKPSLAYISSFDKNDDISHETTFLQQKKKRTKQAATEKITPKMFSKLFFLEN